MIRPVAQNLFDSLMLDTWPRNAAVVDFGLDSQEHYTALQTAIRKGATIEQINSALGDGPAITKIVKKYGSNVEFVTAYDEPSDYLDRDNWE